MLSHERHAADFLQAVEIGLFSSWEKRGVVVQGSQASEVKKFLDVRVWGDDKDWKQTPEQIAQAVENANHDTVKLMISSHKGRVDTTIPDEVLVAALARLYGGKLTQVRTEIPVFYTLDTRQQIYDFPKNRWGCFLPGVAVGWVIKILNF